MKEVFGYILTMAALFAVFIAFGIWMNKAECKNSGEAMLMPSKYVSGVGCLVQTKSGQWIILKNFRGFE